jgi:hypothetical protein
MKFKIADFKLQIAVAAAVGCGLLLPGCAHHPKRPVTHTAAPSLTGATHGVSEAKDFLSRARGTNDEIDTELNALEKDLGGAESHR